MRILQINTLNRGGGAEMVATRLHDAFREGGHDAWLGVGRVAEGVAGAYQLTSYDGWGAWGRGCGDLSRRARARTGRVRGAGRLAVVLDRLARPPSFWDWWRGREDFNYPGTRRLLETAPVRPDVVHAHNLHGGYFDLRVLAPLSHRVPVIVTLHDAWLLSGHCAHSMACERWRTGCGECPDLTLFPAIRRDATAANWRRKRDIYAASRLYVASPTKWLMEKISQSMLSDGIVETKVIPNGVPTAVFRPADKNVARGTLGIPSDALVFLSVANRLRTNRWKDYPTLEMALGMVSEKLAGRRVIFLGVGDAGPPRKLGDMEFSFVPFLGEASTMAAYYQAADVFLHAAKLENFPLTVIEALASGLPVVASDVGGIPEQVKALTPGGGFGPAEADAILVPPADPPALAKAIVELSADADLRARLGENARRNAVARFDIATQAEAYLDWYETISAARAGS